VEGVGHIVNGETVECALILMSEWKVKLPGLLASE
jgi:hypothetical protein